MVVARASLQGKICLLRLLMHQHIPLSKPLSYQLSLIQNHLLWLVSIAPQVHFPLPFLMISCFSVIFCHLSLPPSSSVKNSMSMWIRVGARIHCTRVLKYIFSCTRDVLMSKCTRTCTRVHSKMGCTHEYILSTL